MRLPQETRSPTGGPNLPPHDERAAEGRLLIVPAAGLGTRLRSSTPKLLVEVNGRPMIDWLAELYGPHVARIVLVVHPSFLDAVTRHVSGLGIPVELAVQQAPTGMLDAILLARPQVASSAARHVWITWCDQVAVRGETVARLAERSAGADHPAVVLPTVRRASPYVHFDRDPEGRIVRVRHRREGDAMPEVGETDMGLFALTREAYLDRLPEYASEVGVGPATGERNFLPFIPWIAARARVETISATEEVEATGINTPDELQLVEAHLKAHPR